MNLFGMIQLQSFAEKHGQGKVRASHFGANPAAQTRIIHLSPPLNKAGCSFNKHRCILFHCHAWSAFLPSSSLSMSTSLYQHPPSLALGASTSTASTTPSQAAVQVAQQTIQQATGATPYSAIKPGLDPQQKLISAANPGESYPPINATISYTNPGPVAWTPTRPTLTGGLAAGRISGALQTV